MIPKEKIHTAFYGLFGAMSAAAVGITVVAIPTLVFWYQTIPYRAVLFGIGAVVAAPFGYRAGRHLAQEARSSLGIEIPGKLTLAAVSVFHFGAMLAFAAFLIQGHPTPSPDYFDANSWVYYWFQRLILAYGILRFWTMLARFWKRSYGYEPLFFLGLYLGVFPSLIGALCSVDAFSFAAPVLSWSTLIFEYPGLLVNRVFYFPEDTIPLVYQFRAIIVSSLASGFFFLLVDLFMLRRRSKNHK